MPRPSLGDISRRDALKFAGGAAAVGAGAVAVDRRLAGEDAPTEALDEDESRTLAERFAPDVYYDRHEEWYATDPRPYVEDREDRTVVDGFAAFNGYSRAFEESGEPPDRTLFYNVRRYADSPLAVVQYWRYAAFDQFATNFHWHDWELLQVFVDIESREPQLYVASAHSRSVPNNEFLDPDPDRQPAVIPELGSHSSGLALNEVRDRFQRLPTGDRIADITNGTIDLAAEVPKAYGLPRDEGVTLAFALPELDGQPLHEHPELPDVTREHLVAPELTAREFSELSSPPSDLPARETGLQFGRGDDADFDYELAPVSELTHIDAFVGPQLSFEFQVPEFAEDAVAGHITTTGVPWEQPRFENPASDISDPTHRVELADRYDAIDPGGPVSEVVGRLRSVETSDDAPEDSGVETTDPATGAFALVESDPEAVPSFAGVVVARDIDPGEHRLTVNAPGVAPYSERTSVAEGETTVAGADGDIPLVASENAVKLAVDGESEEADTVDRLAVEDDFGGRLLEATPDGDRDGVYLHDEGAYSVEYRDPDGEVGADRFNPDDQDRQAVVARTGKASLAGFVVDIVVETAEQAPGFAGAETDDGDDDGDTDTGGADSPTGPGADGTGGADVDTDVDDPALRGLLQALEAIATAADQAAERAAGGDAGGADQALATVRSRIESARTDLSDRAADLDDDVVAVTDRRLEQAARRTDQAIDSEKPN